MWDLIVAWVPRFFAFVVFLLGLSLVAFHGFRKDKERVATISSAAVLVVAGFVLMNPEKFQRIAIGSLAVEMQQAVREAQVTTEQARQLSITLANISADFAARMGRFDSAPSSERLREIDADLQQRMLSLGASDDQIAKALEPIKRMIPIREREEAEEREHSLRTRTPHG